MNWQILYVLNYFCPGAWNNAGFGYKNKGTCVTHSNRNSKGASTFVFRASMQGKPQFSGFVVSDYSSYAALTFW